MNRGSNMPQVMGVYPQTRFNEAPIHESGKCEARSLRPVGC